MAFEGDLRMMFHIEKVCATEVIVTFLHSSPDSTGINLYLDRRIARAFWIEIKCAVDVLEVSANVGHHHVPCAKLSRCVPRFKSPFSHRSDLHEN